MSIFNRVIRWARVACVLLIALRSVVAAMFRLIVTVTVLVGAVAMLWSEVMPLRT